MGVDDAERGRFVLQIGENAHQHDVLDDVGKAAGMKGMTVVHGNRNYHVVASGAKQSMATRNRRWDCFVACTPRNDGGRFPCASYPPLIGGIVTCSRRQ